MIDSVNARLSGSLGKGTRKPGSGPSPGNGREEGASRPDVHAVDTSSVRGRRIAVTGATGGIALAILDGLAGEGVALVLQGRSEADLDRLASSLRCQGADVLTVVGDLSHKAPDVADLLASLKPDVLINNAGVYTSGDLLSIDLGTLGHDLEVNAIACVATMRAVLPGMNARGYGRVVNISSGGGSFGEGLAITHAAYAISKAALNAATVLAASCTRGDVKVNATCPGWVRTRMGGSAATRSPAEGADTALWLAALPSDGPSGGFFRDRRPIPW